MGFLQTYPRLCVVVAIGTFFFFSSVLLIRQPYRAPIQPGSPDSLYPMLFVILTAGAEIAPLRHENSKNLCQRLEATSEPGRERKCILDEWHKGEVIPKSVIDPSIPHHRGFCNVHEVALTGHNWMVMQNFLKDTQYRSLVMIEDDAIPVMEFDQAFPEAINRLVAYDEDFDVLNFHMSACNSATTRLVHFDHVTKGIWRSKAGWLSWWAYNVFALYTRHAVEKLTTFPPPTVVDMWIAEAVHKGLIKGHMVCPALIAHYTNFKTITSSSFSCEKEPEAIALRAAAAHQSETTTAPPTMAPAAAAAAAADQR